MTPESIAPYDNAPQADRIKHLTRVSNEPPELKLYSLTIFIVYFHLALESIAFAPRSRVAAHTYPPRTAHPSIQRPPIEKRLLSRHDGTGAFVFGGQCASDRRHRS